MRRGRVLGDLGADERVLRSVGRHSLRLGADALPPLALLLLAAAFPYALGRLGAGGFGAALGALLAPLGVIWLLWRWADWRADRLVLTERRVIWIERTPFVRERRWEAPLGALQNVAAVASGPVARLLRAADLVLDTTSRGVVRLPLLRDGELVARAILDAQDAAGRRSIRLERLRGEAGPVEEPTPPERPDARVWRRHPWLLIAGLLRPGALLFACAVGALLARAPVLALAGCAAALAWGAWLWDDWRNDELVATADRLIATRRAPLALHEESWHAAWESVQDVDYAVLGPLATLLGYGTVTVSTGGDGEAFRFAGVGRPRAVAAELNRRLELRRSQARRDLLGEVERTVEAVLRSRGL